MCVEGRRVGGLGDTLEIAIRILVKTTCKKIYKINNLVAAKDY